MWATGDAFVESDSIFLGSEWSNETATFGGIIGNQYVQITPRIPAVFSPAVPATYTPYIPAIYSPAVPATYTPAIPATYTPAIPAVIVLGVQVTPAIPRVQLTPYIPRAQLTPYISPQLITAAINPQVLTPYIPPLQITPVIPATYGDTRTGATLEVNSSGKVGLEFGYTINSGSVDATIDFTALADLPDQTVAVAEIINLDTQSILEEGSINTQSPEIEAYISAIMKLSGSIDAQACLALAGCATGSANLPNIDVDQRILSIDPNSIKLLDGILPGDEPLAEIPLANQSLTLEGGFTTTIPPAPGFTLSNSYGAALATSFPPAVPNISVDMAEIEVQVPNIATTGELDADGNIKSEGRDDLLSLQLDLDGIASVVAGTPLVGVNFDLISTPAITVGVEIDLIDVDAGPVLGITQDFELFPTLMTSLAFSSSIFIDGMTGLQDSWTGLWDELPSFTLLETTTFSPTYFTNVMIKNDFGLDLGLTGTLDVLKIEAAAIVGGLEVLQFGPLSLNGLLGLGNTLFETDKIGFSIAENEFQLTGFNQVIGNNFTIDVSQIFIPGPGLGPTVIPEPNILWVFASGLIALGYARRRSHSLKLKNG